LELERPAEGVATGQLAALYDGDVVVGAGEIVSAG
ncbi:MAG: aminomethyltransferase beta-barrel domain-containing protein, partial [Gaiella sp.]